MSAFVNFGATSPVGNPDHTYELIGGGANGEGTIITAAGSGNTKGGWVQLSAATAGAWSGFRLCLGRTSSGGLRGLLDISFDGGVTVHAENIPFQSGSSPPWVEILIPLKAPAAADVRVRMQASTASGTVAIAIRGKTAAAGAAPGFDNMVSLTAVPATSLANDVDIGLGDTWVTLVAATARTYGALLAVFSTNSLNPATTQDGLGSVGVGAASSEAVLASINLGLAAGQPSVRNGGLLIERATATGVRLAVKMKAATPGTDAFRCSLHAFY